MARTRLIYCGSRPVVRPFSWNSRNPLWRMRLNMGNYNLSRNKCHSPTDIRGEITPFGIPGAKRDLSDLDGENIVPAWCRTEPGSAGMSNATDQLSGERRVPALDPLGDDARVGA